MVRSSIRLYRPHTGISFALSFIIVIVLLIVYLVLSENKFWYRVRHARSFPSDRK